MRNIEKPVKEQTTIGDLVECFNRMLASGHADSRSQVYMLSRDGRQLRTVGDLSFDHRTHQFRFYRGDDGVTAELIDVAEVMHAIRGHDGEVKIQADGFGRSNFEPLKAVVNPQELAVLEFELQETDVILCP